MATVLPAGLAESAMDRAVQAFERALGSDRVETSEVGLREFRDPYDFPSWDEFAAAAVVSPISAEQVQAVVRIANETGVPLWAFGQGRNNTYGGPAPRVRGSVLVSLRDMNRVLEVSDELAYALLEPGVRFFDLYDHLQAGGHRLWPSIPDLGWGSVVGNSLEYGRGYTTYGDHASSICGLEVVLPSGELLRTGMGAMASSKAWQLYKWGYGPSVDGLFMQSNLGIVTKMGVWLMPEPEVYLSGWAQVHTDEAVGPLVDALRGLMLEGTIRNYPILNRGMSMVEGADEANTWALRFALYGRRPIVEAELEAVREAFAGVPGLTMGGRLYTPSQRGAVTEHDDKVQGGVPGLEIFELFNRSYGDATGHLDLSPVVPLSGREAVESIRLIRSLYGRHNLEYVAGLLFMPRSFLHITTTFYDTRDEAQVRRAYDAYGDMTRELARQGYGLYRTNLRNMDLVAELYDYNDHALRRVVETIKDAVDPAGVISPGKQGIWPRAMRR